MDMQASERHKGASRSRQSVAQVEERAPVIHGPDVAALLDIARALAAQRADPDPGANRDSWISTSLLLFSLVLPAYLLDAKIRLDSPAAMEFGLALKELVGTAFEAAWSDYFRNGIDSVDLSGSGSGSGFAIGSTAGLTKNCANWLDLAGEHARKGRRDVSTIDDLIQAFAEQPPGRFQAILKEMGVTPAALFGAYQRRVRDSAMPRAQQTIFQHLLHDRASNIDLLQLQQYAIAIASFLTSPGTVGPISISIQAPWGAGKSSLMHQVRDLLDPSQGSPPADERLLTRHVLKFLNNVRKGRLPRQSIVPAQQSAPHPEHRPTVWFNAWKYESAEQVWAGLVDTIVTQVSARLPPIDRELFLLRLNLARIDDGVVRQKLYDRVAAYWWAGASTIVAAAVALPTVVYAFAHDIVDPARILCWTGGGLAASLAAWLGWA
jgi:hypothetical protein